MVIKVRSYRRHFSANRQVLKRSELKFLVKPVKPYCQREESYPSFFTRVFFNNNDVRCKQAIMQFMFRFLLWKVKSLWLCYKELKSKRLPKYLPPRFTALVTAPGSHAAAYGLSLRPLF